MIVKCPNCGQWVELEKEGAVDRAVSGAIGGAGGGLLFGNPIIGGIVGGITGALSGSDYHLVCPTCGYEQDYEEYEDETDEYNASLAEDSDTDEAWELFKDEQYAEAEQKAKLILRDNRENLNAWYILGRSIYWQEANKEECDKNRIEEAKDAFRAANNLTEEGSADERTMYNNLGFCYELNGERYQARNCYVLGMEGNPEPQKSLELISDIENQLSDTWQNYADVYKYESTLKSRQVD